MDVILLADRKGQELLPLTDTTCVSLLTVAGKMVIEHTLEALVEANLRQAHIVLSSYAEQVKEVLGNGERWGIRLTYSTSRSEEPAIQQLTSLQKQPTAPFLILRSDIIRSSQISAFLEQAKILTDSCVQALFSGENAYMMLCNDSQHSDLNCLDELNPIQKRLAKTTVNLSGAVATLYSLADYHRANLDVAAGRIPNLLIPGRQTALGLTQGRNTQAYPQNLKQGIALIGSNCHLHPSVELSGDVVIADNVIIDHQASIESSVILTHTYIGELVELRNAIVRGNDLIRVDNGAILKISDSFLLADLKTNTFNKGLNTIPSRVFALLLLLLSSPLWFLALFISLLQNPTRPVIVNKLRGNKIELNDFGVPERTEFSVLEWNVSVPVLRYLPRILAVINGDLRLIGTLPISLETANKRTEEWEKLADQAPSGLLGPTQLYIPIDAPEEEKLMSDSFYVAHASIKNDVWYLLQSFRVFISRKAWFN
jgi:NDP-sugar pyrophosphorylase family protein